MGNKQFSDRLNNELDEMDVPQPRNERIDALAKILNAPRSKAEAILNGQASVYPELIDKLAQELEVNIDWLLGKTDKK